MSASSSIRGLRDAREHWRRRRLKKRVSSFVNHYGYLRIYVPDHPRSHKGYVLSHVVEAEKIIGKPLPQSAVVHHIDGDRLNNSPANLVVCENDQYHKYIHRRERALIACGHADWVKCIYCGVYDSPDSMRVYSYSFYGASGRHSECQSKYVKERVLSQEQKENARKRQRGYRAANPEHYRELYKRARIKKREKKLNALHSSTTCLY
jgi:hypothetical protein